MNENFIQINGISKHFGNVKAVDDVSFSIREGEICGLLGPNGVGKSTLFNIIIGQLIPDFGKVLIDQKNVTNIPIYKRAIDFGVSIVPQMGGIFSDLTCFENLRAISEIIYKNKDEQLFNVEKMISKFQLEAVKNIKAKYLSGGQKKRVCIAMALLTNPKIILMDEPFQGLDIMSTRDLQETIVNLQTEDSTRSCIISDHGARDLLTICDRAIVLANTKIIADGKPSELLKNKKAKSLYFGSSFQIY